MVSSIAHGGPPVPPPELAPWTGCFNVTLVAVVAHGALPCGQITELDPALAKQGSTIVLPNAQRQVPARGSALLRPMQLPVCVLLIESDDGWKVTTLVAVAFEDEPLFPVVLPELPLVLPELPVVSVDDRLVTVTTETGGVQGDDDCVEVAPPVVVVDDCGLAHVR